MLSARTSFNLSWLLEPHFPPRAKGVSKIGGYQPWEGGRVEATFSNRLDY